MPYAAAMSTGDRIGLSGRRFIMALVVVFISEPRKRPSEPDVERKRRADQIERTENAVHHQPESHIIHRDLLSEPL